MVNTLTFAFECPHCGVYATFKVNAEFGNPYWGGFAKILGCDNCRQLVYVVTDPALDSRHNQFNPTKIIDYYPKRTPKVDGSVPENVANDFMEAMVCFDVGTNKASAAMCRRALQSSMLERGAKKERLANQIDELFEKQIITKDIRDWAHEIRLTGNIGAHPDEDGLENITRADAAELIKFMEEYLNYVYVMPAKVAEKRAKKTQMVESKKTKKSNTNEDNLGRGHVNFVS